MHLLNSCTKFCFNIFVWLGKTEEPLDVYYNDKLYGGNDRSIFHPAIMSANEELIEYLQDHVPNAAELLSKEMKKDNRGLLEDCIVKNNLTNLVNFLLNLDDTSPGLDLPDSAIAGICMR